MNFDQKALDKAKKMNTTVVFEGIRIVGDVKGSHNYYLNGELDGKINLSAMLIVGRSGKFNGEAKAENVVVEGDFEGKLTAKEKVEIRDTGKFVGDIWAPSVLVSDRAYFQGKVTMTRDAKTQTHDVREKIREINQPQEKKVAEVLDA